MTLHRFTIAAALALATLCSPAWAVFKCTTTAGKVQYQQTPCTDNTQSQRIATPTSASSTGQLTPEAQAKLDKMQRDKAIFEATQERRPLVGMTLKELENAMGLPITVNADNYEGRTSEQRIFEDKRGDEWYVYTKEGVVDSIQHRPGAAIRPEPQRATNTCTPLKIQNLETKASSFTLSPEEKAAIHERIARGAC